jgi:hypothetical protein
MFTAARTSNLVISGRIIQNKNNGIQTVKWFTEPLIEFFEA